MLSDFSISRLQSDKEQLMLKVREYQNELDRREYERQYQLFKSSITSSDYYRNMVASPEDMLDLLDNIRIERVESQRTEIGIRPKYSDDYHKLIHTWAFDAEMGTVIHNFKLSIQDGETPSEIDVEKEYARLPSIMRYGISPIDYFTIIFYIFMRYDQSETLSMLEPNIQNVDHLTHLTRNNYLINSAN
jgi:hypothetical protein